MLWELYELIDFPPKCSLIHNQNTTKVTSNPVFRILIPSVSIANNCTSLLLILQAFALYISVLFLDTPYSSFDVNSHTKTNAVKAPTLISVYNTLPLAPLHQEATKYSINTLRDARRDLLPHLTLKCITAIRRGAYSCLGGIAHRMYPTLRFTYRTNLVHGGASPVRHHL